MEIIQIDAKDIKPYQNNAKMHSREQIEQIKKSIEEFGNNDPIAIDENNVIIEGHGRYYALTELGYDKLECIRLSHLTEEQKKAYILVHNKLTMNTDFDFGLLDSELKEIQNIKMEDFGFDVGFNIEVPEIEPDKPKINERERTNSAYNLELFNPYNCDGKYQMPIIENDGYIPKDLIGFNYAKTSEDKNAGIHFYLDDYQFERIWNNPDDYIEVLEDYNCILSPDFSLYLDMPLAMKIWNVYRSRLIGQYYQSIGMKVIPTIQWAEEDTFEFCFDGIPEGSIVSVSTIGVKRDSNALDIWKKGMDAMIEKIKPSTILVYGGELDYDYGDIKVIYYENKITERMKENGQ